MLSDEWGVLNAVKMEYVTTAAPSDTQARVFRISLRTEGDTSVPARHAQDRTDTGRSSSSLLWGTYCRVRLVSVQMAQLHIAIAFHFFTSKRLVAGGHGPTGTHNVQHTQRQTQPSTLRHVARRTAPICMYYHCACTRSALREGQLYLCLLPCLSRRAQVALALLPCCRGFLANYAKDLWTRPRGRDSGSARLTRTPPQGRSRQPATGGAGGTVQPPHHEVGGAPAGASDKGPAVAAVTCSARARSVAGWCSARCQAGEVAGPLLPRLPRRISSPCSNPPPAAARRGPPRALFSCVLAAKRGAGYQPRPPARRADRAGVHEPLDLPGGPSP
eukprot:scaffold236_cov419-Prasinococcus_capsulatus_cf.AAC.33